MSDLFIYSFYKFTKVKNKKQVKLEIEKFIKNKVVRGTILIADEGINGSISADTKTLNSILSYIKKLLNIKKLKLKSIRLIFYLLIESKLELKRKLFHLVRKLMILIKKIFY